MVWKLASERAVSDIVCAPGNAGIAHLARCIAVDAADPHALVAIAKREEIDFTIVGPELPLSRGVADVFADEGLLLFGPSQRAARLESSKVFAKEFMQRNGVPTARYKSCDSAAQALAILRGGEFPFPVVLKADGLAAGKGVVISADLKDAETQVHAMMVDKRYGHAGARLVIEELLVGREASFFALCDGTRAVPLGSAEDHKRAFDGDTGPNTGGMGAYCPVSLATDELLERVADEVFKPTLKALANAGARYRGVLYAGLMLQESDGALCVIEFNCRFGDPEAQAILAATPPGLLPVLRMVAEGGWMPGGLTMGAARKAAVTTVLAAEGYPHAPKMGAEIRIPRGLESARDVLIFHAGTTLDQDGRLRVSGGRVLSVTATAPNVAAAAARSRAAAEAIDFEGKQFRRDIGWREIARGSAKVARAGRTGG